MKVNYIYALVDPCTDECRYVGWTVRPKHRLRRHIDEARKGIHPTLRSARWINQLLQQNLEPRMEILEEGMNDWVEAERRWIKLYREAGCRLTNISAGGQGASFSPTPEHREKLSKALKGKKRTAEQRQAMSDARRGVEKWRRIATENSGWRHDPEHCRHAAKKLHEKHPDLHEKSWGKLVPCRHGCGKTFNTGNEAHHARACPKNPNPRRCSQPNCVELAMDCRTICYRHYRERYFPKSPSGAA